MMNVVETDNETLAVAAVHGQRVVAGFKDFAIFKGDVFSTNEAHSRIAALKSQAANYEVRAIDKLNVILTAISGMDEYRPFAVGGTDDNWPLHRALCRHGPPAVLGIRSAVQD